MNVSVSVSGLDEFLADELTQLKVAAQGAMAEKFLEITRENFGDEGVDRPNEWPALSPKYAKRVKRDHATLFLSGDLETSITFDASNPDYAEVSTANPYASAHQFGNPDGNLPARGFFPLTNEYDGADAQLTEFAEAEVLKAAQDEIDKRVK